MIHYLDRFLPSRIEVILVRVPNPLPKASEAGNLSCPCWGWGLHENIKSFLLLNYFLIFFPALLLLQPRTARALLDYRLNRSQERYQRFSTTKKQFFTDLTKLEIMPPPQDGQEPGSRGRVLLPVERFSF